MIVMGQGFKLLCLVRLVHIIIFTTIITYLYIHVDSVFIYILVYKNENVFYLFIHNLICVMMGHMCFKLTKIKQAKETRV